MGIVLSGTGNRGPLWSLLEETHGVNVIGIIGDKSVVDACRKDDQVSGEDVQTDPPILCIPDVKVPRAFEDIPDLLILVQMFLEKLGHAFLVVGEVLGGNAYLVSVVIASLGTQLLQGLV